MVDTPDNLDELHCSVYRPVIANKNEKTLYLPLLGLIGISDVAFGKAAPLVSIPTHDAFLIL